MSTSTPTSYSPDRISRYDSLQANLVETANLGRYAFNSAETGMGQISMAADIIDGKVGQPRSSHCSRVTLFS